MPAERSKSSKRNGADGVQLTWTTPVEATMPQAIAFAPNVTPGTFTEPCFAADAPPESTLFPPNEDLNSSSRRVAHGKKKPENHIPRPPNAFILFRSAFIKNQHVSSEVETNHSTLSKIIGLTWQNLPHEERQVWHAKAKAALDEHKRRWPQYAFKPLHAKAKGAPEKRKVREVGPKDQKRCEKIAELLVQGKKGTELDAAIQEFDRHHVPQIVTRFEAPITARAYRRSSSAPAPDTDHTKLPEFCAPTSPSMASRKLRASSTQPTRASSPATSDDSLQGSQVDCGSETDSFYDYSSSSTPSPSTFPDSINPFDFNTFTFTETVAHPETQCDPLSPMPDPHQMRMYLAHGNDLSSGYQPTYDQTTLSVDTSFFGTWSTESSPLSSIPGTPHCYPAVHPNACEMSSSGSVTPCDPYATFEGLGMGSCGDPFEIPPPCDTYNAAISPNYYGIAFSNPSGLPVPYYTEEYDSSSKGQFLPVMNEKSDMAHLTMDLSAFMASVSQY
ncbi:hypothetical protein JAAARDRAFT_209377 [Jaapia argillacea MUCL 33604]|uniref:HMG box domain-containing protein n=1 Tax=Jaapia argillacea MUCL 33604 TaxID=933084 RepID=A0A067PK49_9AGAM|nr:hypothetical protein JAAARDRAFT_209377 [Jaapia argillacea MUCL 33604]